jgi:glycine dehydrogenase subunit 1
MDVANASLYDGASAAAEAVLMARRVTRRSKVLVSSAVHPEYRETVVTYLKGTAQTPTEIDFCKDSGTTLIEEVERNFDDDTACLVVQYPNFFGGVEDLQALADMVHSKKGLLIVVVSEALSLGALTPPGELGADIVVGEAQSFGSPLSYGGPYLGFMGVKDKHLRQMPGRVVGQTKDGNDRRSYCLTMATREQHIRREKATSNICTNQGLVALSCTIYLTLLGKGGLMRLARLNMAKAAFLKEQLGNVAGIKIAFSAPNFNEFVIEIKTDPKVFLKALLEKGIAGGVELGRFYPDLKNHILIAATEMNSRAEMEAYAKAAALAQV